MMGITSSENYVVLTIFYVKHERMISTTAKSFYLDVCQQVQDFQALNKFANSLVSTFLKVIEPCFTLADVKLAIQEIIINLICSFLSLLFTLFAHNLREANLPMRFCRANLFLRFSIDRAIHLSAH